MSKYAICPEKVVVALCRGERRRVIGRVAFDLWVSRMCARFVRECHKAAEGA